MLRTLVAACMLLSTSAGAQTFEVASIKPSPPMEPGRPMRGIQTPRDTGRLNAMSVSLRMLILWAYDAKEFQLSGGPGWANTDLYEVMAKGEGKASREQLKLMLQALLKERFKLQLRRETKDAPIYELVIAKGGPKMQEDTTSPGQRIALTGPGKIMALRASPAALAGTLSTIVADRPVVDKTGLSSEYTFKLEWTPAPGERGLAGPLPPSVSPSLPPDVAPSDPTGPSLFSALQEQLGLRLQSARGPVENLVIEKAEKPTEN